MVEMYTVSTEVVMSPQIPSRRPTASSHDISQSLRAVSTDCVHEGFVSLVLPIPDQVVSLVSMHIVFRVAAGESSRVSDAVSDAFYHPSHSTHQVITLLCSSDGVFELFCRYRYQV